jgi:hypothetical protein
VREAAVVIDMMAAAELMSLRQLASYLATMAGGRGVRQVRRALELSSEESLSPNETRLRLIWVVDAGLPMPLVNQPVFDLDGALLGIADLLDPVAGLGGGGACDRSGHPATGDGGRPDPRSASAGRAGPEASGAVDPRAAGGLAGRDAAPRPARAA